MIGQTKKAERSMQRLSEDRSFAIRLMEYLVVPTFVIDQDSRVLVWNKACERLTGVMADDVVNTRNHWRAFYSEPRPCLADLLARGDYDGIRALYANWDGFGLSDFGVSVENWCVMPKLGRQMYLAVDAGPIYDESGTLVAVVETIRDITAQHEAQRNLEHLATQDGLTELPNRRSFDEALTAELRRAAREDQPLSLLMLDVDCFKAYNDNYGHQRGDECLKSVAQAIRGALLRAGDTAARYGGEEFAVLLPNTDVAGARLIAERICASVALLGIHHAASTAACYVTVSIGSATGEGSDLDAARLLGAADSALYASKHGGRNRVTTAEAEPSCVLF